MALRERLSRLDLELPPSAVTHRQQWVLLPHRTSFAPFLALFGSFCCVDAALWVLSVVSSIALCLYSHIIDGLLLRPFVCNQSDYTQLPCALVTCMVCHVWMWRPCSQVQLSLCVMQWAPAAGSRYTGHLVCHSHAGYRWPASLCSGTITLWCQQHHRNAVIYHKVWSNGMTILGVYTA